MANKIIGKEYPVKDIFNKIFDYYIPPYQRPYAWSEEETRILFEDLYDFYKTADKEDNYFLGSIVLKKEEDIPQADVIDGQQRLTTLTILIAVMCSLMKGENFDSGYKYIQEKGDKMEGIEPKPRLHLREKDQPFFNKYIQNIKIDELLQLNSGNFKNEAQRHIQENCAVFRKCMMDYFKDDEEEIFDFCSFLIKRCYLVVVCAPSQQSAFRVFSVMNSRGMDLLPIDIVKADVIGKIPPSEQQKYTDKWEEFETFATRDGFNEVFTHLRMIFAKTKAKKSLLEEFTQYVVKKLEPKQLIDDYLAPYTNAYIHIKNKNYESVKNAEEINKCLFWLNKLEFSDWMPVAMKFYVSNQNDPDYMLWFFKKFERLTSYLHVTARDINQRIERYKLILDEMDNNPNSTIDNPLRSIELTSQEKKNFVTALNGDIYLYPAKRRNYIILRLNDFVSDGAQNVNYSPDILTIEHVLPQTVKPETEWAKTWPDEEIRKLWLNKIANLVPLTRQKNSKAQNYDFRTKVDIYFRKNGTTSYPLTTQVVMETKWTLDLVEQRQKQLIQVFKDKWDLNYVDEVKQVINDDNNIMFFLKLRGANAQGYPKEKQFVVTKGSRISKDIVPSLETGYPSAFVLRNELITNSTIQDDVFTKDFIFDSSSLAGSVVIGRPANGYSEWKDASDISLGEYANEAKKQSEETE